MSKFTHADFAELWGKLADLKHQGKDCELPQLLLIFLEDHLLGKPQDKRVPMLIEILRKLENPS
jgi:hypothetical protein